MRRKILLFILTLMFCPSVFGQNKVTVNLQCNPEGAAILSVNDNEPEIGQILKITALVNPGYTLINWTDDNGNIVSESEVFEFEVTTDVNLTANLAQNHWMPNPNAYAENTTLIAVVEIDGIEQRNRNYEVGAFCNEEVRGSERLYYEEVKDRYYIFLMIYGKNGDNIRFKLYDHETGTEYNYSEKTIIFTQNGTGGFNDPYVLTFTGKPMFIGNGSWYDEANWSNSKLPGETDDVIINGDAVISEGDAVTVNSLVINEGKSLTIENEAMLTVSATLTNSDVNALIIEDGGQIFQTNNEVAATFRKNIVNPTGTWGNYDQSGWQFVSSPMQNSLISDFAPENGDYDLYKYDGTLENEWYNFKKSTVNSFNNGMQGWTTKDADDDGHNWILANGYIYSESYDIDNDEELSPENYLISPLVNPEFDGTLFKFKACAEDDFYREYCGVAVSEDGVNFTMMEGASWYIGEGVNEGEMSQWYEKTVDLTEYADKDIYVAICHYDVKGSYNLIIDQVELCRNNGIFENGISYLVSYETEEVSEFKGFLNKETSYKITVPYDNNNPMANYSLLGNPFPYNIDWGTDVKVVGVNNAYAVVKADGGYEYKTDGIIKVGEGFMVNSVKGRSHNITFGKNINSSKRNSENSSVNIVASSKYGSDNVIVNFGEEGKAFPKLDNFNEKIADIYVKSNDTVYGILNYDESVAAIPVYFSAKEMASYTLSFDVKGQFDELYLVDNMTGETVNILVEKEYSFTSGKCDDVNRFTLTSKLTASDTQNDIFAYINNGDLVIDNITSDAVINIYDMRGCCVYSDNCSEDNNRINISAEMNNLPSCGIYIIKLIDDKGIRTQKIVF